ncbi:hypothetical protein D8B26_002459 [Coccidioides posadasii str. Silveira]|uniref:Uncharacterized protein n=3 Tax=Coccidioides posadasii TaxID=199306 RepID=E9DHE3_COCPS|nr:Zinc finger CCCH type domain containing protein [Coccidioides posadasii C735 delta SOWgp]EER24255.1 Zinc finger CCCH type domain containing protein [Coccidioides posadasii C735 delta SOWgp]EFW14168.1 hypothetical protein CPSG_09242 [Coccidioides posadasii str. Silveira]KMM65897.1 CCCH zinc finger and SMR domain-containing protein [Coccidioides posadasii RMSCC 3488]QVM07768.1 hypothetical protein D8B26_002459 [Coccidioides posadasii str. Silveira]|eukprot:XP_003066400.1 Zinc finger CCCH type domain containing protein [Coccidioides posadasii C735 delta SOWgp]
MVSEEVFESCLPILNNAEVDEEEKVEKVEEFLRDKAALTGSILENAVLDVLWRHRNSLKGEASPPPLRHTVIRRSSPAPWQITRSSTPLSSPSNSPAVPSGFPVPRGGFPRAPRSLTASPFTSPRPSPRLAFAQPIPHSPNLNAYEFAERTSIPEYGDLGSDNVDWLVNDDARSTASSTVLSGAAPEWIAPADMSPYDILRSVLGDRRSNDEIEAALAANGYDLGATIAALTEQDAHGNTTANNEGRILVGKSMAVEQTRPLTPSGQARSPVVCKYWLSTGQCLRADCRFSHDLTNHICKYWLMGNCLAGDVCPFSHDPSALVGNLNISDSSAGYGSPSTQPQQMFYPQDNYEAFPALQPAMADQWSTFYPQKHSTQFVYGVNQHHRGNSPSNIRNRNMLLNQSSRPHSRPTSRHQQRDSGGSALSVDDPEAFPTLSSLNPKASGKKHHGKRGGHNHNRETSGNKEGSSSSLTDAVRMSPSSNQRKGTPKIAKPVNAGRENSAAAQSIPTPKHLPWLESGPRANPQYLKCRTDAITHGNVRNKFLQSAAQAWNRNDARAAKALSLRGQAENEAMRRCYREAARHLYEGRSKNSDSNTDDEIYVDLHGLHPGEAIEYLESILKENAKLDRKLLYAITGTGHHSRNGKDKIGKAVKNWLDDWEYVYCEFNVPSERGGYVGGVLGIDPTSSEKSGHITKTNGKSVPEEDKKTVQDDEADNKAGNSTPTLTMGKIQLLKRDDSGKK